LTPWAWVAFESYPCRTPLLTIMAVRLGLLVTVTLPERIDAGHVRFGCELARSAARYAGEVERISRAESRHPRSLCHDAQR
jgi:hypothetical protein